MKAFYFTLIVAAIAVGVLSSFCSAQCDGPLITKDLTYQWIQRHSKIWCDHGSDADQNVCIWRLDKDQVPGCKKLYSLGDYAQANYDESNGHVVSVFDQDADGLTAKPAGVAYAWRDLGSGAKKDVSIYRLVPPQNFTCLGYVAVASYISYPDLSNYRCLASSIVTTTTNYDIIWTDEGSPTDDKVQLYRSKLDVSNGLSTNLLGATQGDVSPGKIPIIRRDKSEEIEVEHRCLEH